MANISSRKTSKPHARLGFLLLCVLFFLETLAAASSQDCVPTRDPQILKKREQELRETAEELLRAFRTGDEDAFFKLAHEKYFGFGAEGKDYTLSELKESFRKKEEMYCYLFDSSCIAPLSPPSKGKELSFSELAKRSGARVERAEVWTVEGIEGCRGHINYIWPGRPGEEFSIPISRFTFMYEGGRWKTVGFDEPFVVDIKSMPRPNVKQQ